MKAFLPVSIPILRKISDMDESSQPKPAVPSFAAIAKQLAVNVKVKLRKHVKSAEW